MCMILSSKSVAQGKPSPTPILSRHPIAPHEERQGLHWVPANPKNKTLLFIHSPARENYRRPWPFWSSEIHQPWIPLTEFSLTGTSALIQANAGHVGYTLTRVMNIPLTNSNSPLQGVSANNSAPWAPLGKWKPMIHSDKFLLSQCTSTKVLDIADRAHLPRTRSL